jgi:7-keto-8-aminopelargonate synthetase-like enzyme
MDAPPELRAVSPTEVRWRGRTLVLFGGCDYFRLSHHPLVRRAVAAGLREDGLNVAASRLTTGGHPLYAKLEQRLARFFRAESALVVSTGYVANAIAAQALAGQVSHVLMDESAHPSMADAAAQFGAPISAFAHASPDALRAQLKRLRPRKPVVITDGMFAFNGTVAPLARYLAVLPKAAWLMVDDCHGAGVLGAHGRGSIEHEGIPRDRVIQTITLSKALGAYGGAVLAPVEVRDAILARSRMFIGSTPPPLPLMRAALASLEILSAGDSLRQRLHANAAWLRAALRSADIPAPDAPGPIVALTARTPEAAQRVRRALLREGIHPPFLRYPGAPPQGQFRFVISSAHTRRQLRQVADVLCAHAAVWDSVQPR